MKHTEMIKITGGEIPITITESDGKFAVAVDGVRWFQLQNEMHAKVLFCMMRDHLTEYMHYEKI